MALDRHELFAFKVKPVANIYTMYKNPPLPQSTLQQESDLPAGNPEDRQSA